MIIFLIILLFIAGCVITLNLMRSYLSGEVNIHILSLALVLVDSDRVTVEECREINECVKRMTSYAVPLNVKRGFASLLEERCRELGL